MQNPENMLSSLNAALRRLRAATEVLRDPALNASLQDVMRRLLLAEVMGSHWIVAVGGAQGAGKTTFLATLYDLHGDGPQWLKGNEGRGEKMPVLVTEVEGLQAPQGFVRRLVPNTMTQEWEVRQVPVEMAEFQKAITDPSAGDLLPVLQVAKRYFDLPDKAWLLLPGYEEQDRDNVTWQSLMRQAMVAAGGCIVVTDETRMADTLGQDIVNDMLGKELQHTQPYIVISKTEGKKAAEIAALRCTAQNVFLVPPALATSHILCTGLTDPVYTQAWRAAFAPVMDSLNRDGSAKRAQQLGQLAQLVSTELGEVLLQVRTQSLLYFRAGQAGANADWVQDVMQRFQEAKAALLAEHLALVQQVAGAKYAAASHLLDQELMQHHEGFGKTIQQYVRGDTAKKLALRKAAHSAWSQSPNDIYRDYAQGLSGLTGKALGRSDGRLLPAPQAQQLLASKKGQQWLQLGYVTPAGQPTVYAKLTAHAQSDMQILLNPQAQLAVVDETPQAQRRASQSLRKSVQLIPATALEYMRLMYADPNLLKQPPDHLKPQAATEQMLAGQGHAPAQGNEVEGAVDHATKAMELGKTAIRSIATMLAVDVATDGDSDILATIFGRSNGDASGAGGGEAASAEGEGGTPPFAGAAVAAAAPLMLHPVAVAAAATVAAGYLTSKAFERLREVENTNSVQAHRVLGQIHDQYVQHFTDEAARVVNAAGEQLEESLRARYRLDEAWMHKERLAVAQADVESLVHRLQDGLAASPAGLQLLNAQHGR